MLEREDSFWGSMGIESHYDGGTDDAVTVVSNEMTFSGTAAQATAGIEDSPERMLEDWPAISGGDPGSEWVEAFSYRNVDEVFEWLLELGLPLTFCDVCSARHGHSVPRSHFIQGPPSLLVSGLLEPIPDTAKRTGHEVTGLEVDDSGHVVGVRYRTQGGEGTIFAARTVLATGGYQRNVDWIVEARPELEGMELVFACLRTADGSGHALLTSLGAAWDNADALALLLHGTSNPLPGQEGEDLKFSHVREGIWVDSTGARFTNERGEEFEVGEAVALDAEGLAWQILDSAIMSSAAFMDGLYEPGDQPVVALEDVIAAGYAHQADTLAELAAAIGADVATLADEVEAFNLAVQGAQEDPWQASESGGTVMIETAPFYALRILPAASKAFGGIDVDLSGHVLDANGVEIPGVLAAGELVGMAGGSLVGDRGFAGSMSAVLLSGRIAGATAGDEAATH